MLGLSWTAQFIWHELPHPPCPTLPSMGQGQLQHDTFGILPARAGTRHPIAKMHQKQFGPSALESPLGDELGKKLFKCKPRQAPILISFLAAPVSNMPMAWHPQHNKCSAFAPWFS